MNTFPLNESEESLDEKIKNINSLIFGNRFRADQTVYEYLIEFLLIFVSAKNADFKSGKMEFHSLDSKTFDYWVEPRMGLRRFIFFDRAKKSGTIPKDQTAFDKINKLLQTKLADIEEDEKKEVIENIRDLLYGYAVIIKTRNWCDQSLLPVCPELVFCEAMPNEKYRRNNVDLEFDPPSIDTSFDFNRRNYLARGGELYYLHILQGINNDSNKKDKLEKLLKTMLSGTNSKLSKIADFIQESWYDEMNFSNEQKYQKLSLSFIPMDAYKEICELTVDELINYLSCDIHKINKVDVLAKGIMFQIMRMLSNAVYSYLGVKPKKWIIDMKGTSSSNIRKLSTQNLDMIENDFMIALNKKAKELNIKESKEIYDSKKHSIDIFKTRGKEIQCIIPPKGSDERFTLSEDVIRFLVLSIIKPQQKMTLDMFLDELYKHYGLIIGPKQYIESLDEEKDMAMADSFNSNYLEFQEFLKNTGFLRELSDATSIVENPYTSVEEN